MPLRRLPRPPSPRSIVTVSLLAGLSGCGSWQLPPWLGGQPITPPRPSVNETEAQATPSDRREVIAAVTANHRLITFQANAPDVILSRVPLMGLLPGESLLGIDHRVARGQLFGLSTRGRLLLIQPDTGEVKPIGAGVSLPVARTFGFDFNPTVDRIRVVSDAGHNLRLHPDTGAQVDGDPAQDGVQPDATLAYVRGDALAGRPPHIVSAGYTYNRDDDKLTSNYAIDARAGTLVVQGSIEGRQPVVSPNTGQLSTVGALQVRAFDHAAFDIADTNNRAYLVTGRIGSASGRLYEVDLATGRAGFIGLIGQPRERDVMGAIIGMSVVP